MGQSGKVCVPLPTPLVERIAIHAVPIPLAVDGEVEAVAAAVFPFDAGQDAIVSIDVEGIGVAAVLMEQRLHQLELREATASQLLNQRGHLEDTIHCVSPFGVVRYNLLSTAGKNDKGQGLRSPVPPLNNLQAEVGEFAGQFGGEAIPKVVIAFAHVPDFPCNMFGNGERDRAIMVPIGIDGIGAALGPEQFVKIVAVIVAIANPVDSLAFASRQREMIHYCSP